MTDQSWQEYADALAGVAQARDDAKAEQSRLAGEQAMARSAADATVLETAQARDRLGAELQDLESTASTTLASQGVPTDGPAAVISSVPPSTIAEAVRTADRLKQQLAEAAEELVAARAAARDNRARQTRLLVKVGVAVAGVVAVLLVGGSFVDGVLAGGVVAGAMVAVQARGGSQRVVVGIGVGALVVMVPVFAVGGSFGEASFTLAVVGAAVWFGRRRLNRRSRRPT